MEHLQETIRGDIKQCIFSLCILALMILGFLLVSDMLFLFALALGVFALMALLSAILSFVELRRAKFAQNRIAEAIHSPQKTLSVQIQKVILLSCPAPKYDEYLVCALMTTPDKRIFIYPFPKKIDSSGPIRSDIRKKLTATPLTLVCRGDSGVVEHIAEFSPASYPTTAYRPTIRRR